MTSLSRGQLAWAALAALTALCYVALGLGGPLRGPGVPHYLVFYSAAFTLYLGALVLLRRRPPGLRLIWAAAVVFRGVLWLSPPTLSDDVYRYMWDGRVAVHGISPYAHKVSDPALDHLETPSRALVNNHWMATPYLPAAQIVFAVLARAAPADPLVFQVFMAGCDLLAGGLCMRLLRRAGRPPYLAAVYLWNPLVVVEAAHGAHLDALMLALTLGALAALLSERRALSAALLALATLTKGIPALLLFALWPRWRPRHWFAYLGVLAGLALPYLWGAGLGLFGPRDGVGLFGAIRLYAYQWNFNGGLYHWLEGLATGIYVPGPVPADTPGAQEARWIAAGLLALALLGVAWLARRARDPLCLLRLCTLPLAGYLLLATTVHPWYVTLLVPFAVFELARGAPSAAPQPPGPRAGLGHLPIVYWSWSVGLSYLTYLDLSNFRELGPVRLWEYLPVYLLVLIWAVVALAHRRARAANNVVAV